MLHNNKGVGNSGKRNGESWDGKTGNSTGECPPGLTKIVRGMTCRHGKSRNGNRGKLSFSCPSGMVNRGTEIVETLFSGI